MLSNPPILYSDCIAASLYALGVLEPRHGSMADQMPSRLEQDFGGKIWITS